MAAPKKIDYERIEPAWRAGIKSPAQLAFEYTEETGTKVSHAAIIKHFKKLGVPRDLAAKVKAKADSMVMQAMVTGKVSVVTNKRDSEIIEDSALVVANVRVSHRESIGRSMRLVHKLFDELGDITDERATLKELIDQLSEGEDSDTALLDLAKKMASLPSRTKTMKELSETLKTLITLERQAYDLGGEGAPSRDKMSDDELDARIRQIQNA